MASHEIGNLGPSQSEPIQVSSARLAGLPSLLPWIIVAVLLVWRGLSNSRDWAVVVPLVIIFVLWSLAARILPFDSISMALLAQGVGDFSAALAVLWLMMGGLTRRNRWQAFLPSLVMTVAVGSLAALSESSTTDSELTITRLLGIAVASLAVCSSLMLAARCSGQAVVGRRFLAWLPAWLLLITVGGVLVIAATVMLIEDHSLQFFFAHIDDILLIALVISAAICLVFVPFIVLATQSRFHRQRLEAYIGANPPRTAGATKVPS